MAAASRPARGMQVQDSRSKAAHKSDQTEGRRRSKSAGKICGTGKAYGDWSVPLKHWCEPVRTGVTCQVNVISSSF